MVEKIVNILTGRPPIRRLTSIFVLLLFLAVIPAGTEYLHAETYSPEQVKAAMLIKFTDFITWPKEAFETDPDSFVMGVLASPEIFRLLSTMSGKMVQGRLLHVVRLTEWPQGPGIHMIYMDSSGLGKWEDQIRANNLKTLLTVSNSDQFLKAGGILSFITKKGGRLGFAVNRAAQKHSSLIFSSALLGLASIRTYDQEKGK